MEYHRSKKYQAPDGLAFWAFCFAGSREFSWSLGPLQCQENAREQPALAAGLHNGLAVMLGAERVFAPNPTEANANIICPETLGNRIVLAGYPESLLLFRNKGCPADGSFLSRRGDAGVFSTAGCPLIVLWSPGQLAFAHAGRDSLIDRACIDPECGKKPRAHASVVNALLTAHNWRGRPFSDIRVWVFYAIPPSQFEHKFDHPEYGRYNSGLVEHLPKGCVRASIRVVNGAAFINLPQLIKWQFIEKGVPEEWISTDDSHAYLPPGFFHTRNTPAGVTTRNLTGVVITQDAS